MEKKSIAESVDGFVRKDTSDGTQGLKQKSDVGSAAVYDDAVKEMRKSDDLAKANIEPAVKASDELARQTADTKGAPVPKTADLKAMHLSEGFAEYLGENFSGVSGNVVRCTDASKVRGLVECARRDGVHYSLRRIGEGFLFRFSGDAHTLSEGRLDARQKKALRADLGDRVGSLGEDWTIVRDCKDAEYPWGLSVGGKRYDSLSLGEGLKISRMGKDCLKESDGSDDLEPRYDGRKSFYGKATVRMFGDGRKVLYSYGTPVCRIDRNGHATLLDKGYYGWGSSNTTRRHVREFLRQNGLKADSSSQIGRDYPEEQARDDEGLEQAGGDYQVVLWECDGHMNPDYDSEVGCGRYGTLDEAVGSVKGAAKLSGGMIDEEYAVLDKSGNVVRTFFASTGKAAK